MYAELKKGRPMPHPMKFTTCFLHIVPPFAVNSTTKNPLPMSCTIQTSAASASGV